MKRKILLSVIILLAATVVACFAMPANTTFAAEVSAADIGYVNDATFSLTAEKGGSSITEGTVQDSAVVFTLASVNKKNEGVEFYYYAADKSNYDPTACASWAKMIKTDDGYGATLTVDGTSDKTVYYYFKSSVSVAKTEDGVTTTYNYSYYFSRGSAYVFGKKSGVNAEEVKYYYDGETTTEYDATDNTQFGALSHYELRIEAEADVSDGVIKSVSVVAGNGESYATGKDSVSATYRDVRFTLTSVKENPSVSYQYRLISVSSDDSETAGEWNNMNGKVFALNATSVGAKEFYGRIEFRASLGGQACEYAADDGSYVFGDEDKTRFEGEESEYTESKLYVKWSVISPEFGVSASYVDPITNETKEYASGSWAPSSVVYRLALNVPMFSQNVDFYYYLGSYAMTDGSLSFSGGEYGTIGKYVAGEKKYYDDKGGMTFYYGESQWKSADGRTVNSPSVSVAFSSIKSNVRFLAVASSGANATAGAYTVNIDSTTPELGLTIGDAQGRVFAPTDTIYATNRLTFTLTNNKQSSMPSAQKAEFQYKTPEGDWTTIDGVTSDGVKRYRVGANASGENQSFDSTYSFRVVSASGLVSDVTEVTFGIDSSEFDFSTYSDNTQIGYDTTAEWAYMIDSDGTKHDPSEGLRIKATVRQKGIYSFYYTVADREGETEMEIEGEPTEYNGAYTYTCILKDGVKDGKFTFYAKNRAGDVSRNKVTLDNPISIDSFPAAVAIKGSVVGGSDVETSTEGSVIVSEYINGRVNLTISPVKSSTARQNNASGFRIYRVYSENTTEELDREEDGSFSLKNCSDRGDYVFRMVTGAGVVSEITYRLNIESADIIISDGTKIYISDEDGNYGDTAYTIEDLANKHVANKIKIVFSKNDGYKSPFNISYAVRTDDGTGSYATLVKSSTDGVVELDLKKIKKDGSFSADDSADFGSKAEFAFVFRLESVARSADNTRKVSDGQLISFTVNRTVGNVSVTRDPSQTSGWVKQNVKIYVVNDKDYDSSLGYVYQIRYGESGEWSDIDLSTVAIARSDGGATITLTLESHFNGTVYFRTLNSAGFTGNSTTSLALTYDATSPDVLRAIAIGANCDYTAYDIVDGDKKDLIYGTVETGADGGVTVYSYQGITLRSPVYDATSPFAPTLFFYATEKLATTPETTFDGNGNLVVTEFNGWSSLTADWSPSGETTAYMYATNGVKNSGIRKVDFRIDSTNALTFNLRYSASAGSQDISDTSVFVFNWSESNTVNMSGISTYDVRYQVKLNGAWRDLHDDWKTAGTTFSYEFNKDSLTDLIGKTSVQATVSFRMVSKTGAAVVATGFVKLQVDSEEPEFDLIVTVGGKEYVNPDFSGKWFSSVMTFSVRPKNPDANPGGVTYSYNFEKDPAFGAGESSSSVIYGTVITSNNIGCLVNQRTASGKDVSGGFGTLTFFATTKAGKRTAERSVRINIDALEPEFAIDAYYTDDDGKQTAVSSGDWVNAEKVTLTLKDIGKTSYGSSKYYNVSDVTTYIMYSDSGAGNYNVFDKSSIELTEKTKIYFKAVSSSGLTVEKTFDVNIDRKAPEIKTRIISGGTYYVDERISWLHDDDTTKVSTLNGMHFGNGDIVSTETINLFKYTTSNSAADVNYGLCKLYLEDLAGNVSTYEFYMRPFALTVDNIEDTPEDRALLEDFKAAIDRAKVDYVNGETVVYEKPLTNARETYFDNLYDRLLKRLGVLQKEVTEFRNYLYTIAGKTVGSFSLQGEYAAVSAHVLAYNGYAEWEKNSIVEGTFEKNGATYKYNTVYNTLNEAYETLERSMQTVLSVQDGVAALPATMVVATSDYEEIMRAYNSYASLTADQKSAFATRLYEKLVAVRSRCEELMLTTDTGVKIEGEKLPEGVRLVAEEVNKSTDDYIAIQSKILSASSSTEPRSVVLVRKIYLTGENSSNPTGTMTLTIEIPEGTDDLGIEYRSYTAFAVYRYMTDGSVLKMSDLTVAPDGKSVSFTSDSLGTYALASNSSVREKSDSEKVYGYIGDIALDGTMITYIAVGAGVLFAILIIILIITGVRRRAFLARYDEKYRYGLRAKGITRVPKGNKARARNPRNRKEYARPMPAGLKEGKPFDERKIKKARKKAEKAKKEAETKAKQSASTATTAQTKAKK